MPRGASVRVREGSVRFDPEIAMHLKRTTPFLEPHEELTDSEMLKLANNATWLYEPSYGDGRFRRFIGKVEVAMMEEGVPAGTIDVTIKVEKYTGADGIVYYSMIAMSENGYLGGSIQHSPDAKRLWDALIADLDTAIRRIADEEKSIRDVLASVRAHLERE